MGRSVLIANPGASGVTPELIAAVARELEARGPLEQLLTEGPGHATELARAACDRSDAVFVFAGDGGFNEVANGMSVGVPVGFLPGGATSVLSRALGLPRDPVACARRLAASPATRLIGLGSASYLPATDERRSRLFTFSAGVGLDAELVRAVDAHGRVGGRRARDLAFVWELARLLARSRGRIDAGVTVEGHGRAAFAIVTNCDPYTFAGPFAVHATPLASFELGLDLVAPRRVRPRDLARIAWWVLLRPRGQVTAEDVIYVHDADRLVVQCDAPTPLQLDGEDLGDVVEVTLEARRAALTVIT